MRWVTLNEFPEYQVSNLGDVRRLYKSREPRALSQHWKRPKVGSSYLVVSLSSGGVKKEMKVHRLVYEAFNGKTDKAVAHRNGMADDNRLVNLVAVTPNQLGTATGWKARSRKVMKVDRNGKETLYRSLREASRHTDVTYSTISDACHGNHYCCDGSCYYWYDEYHEIMYEEGRKKWKSG